ncbi:MAG: septal ring lytic transglycosylase RlpA family protein [Bryobacterales bacterium]
MLVLLFSAAFGAAAQSRKEGNAGFYSDWFVGKTMANGQLVDQDDLTASIGSYPFDTKLRITNLDNDETIEVRVTDRPGPKTNEMIVVTRAAAEELGFLDAGRARVEIEVVELGNDHRYGEVAQKLSVRQKRHKRGGLAEPGKKPSPFAYSEP